MHSNNRFIVRRTISQERFEVLWKKRMEGEPTLKELAEMDEIINRDPLVRQFVLNELENCDLPVRNDSNKLPPPTASLLKKLAGKVKAFFKRLITFFASESELVVN